MSCKYFEHRVGYKGQRYEVRFKDGEDKERIFGWTNDPLGGGMVKSVELHPVWHDPVVVDLKPRKKVGR